MTKRRAERDLDCELPAEVELRLHTDEAKEQHPGMRMLTTGVKIRQTERRELTMLFDGEVESIWMSRPRRCSNCGTRYGEYQRKK